MGTIVHWKLARRCNFEAGDKWYEHEPESVVDKKERNCKIIDFEQIIDELRLVPIKDPYF